MQVANGLEGQGLDPPGAERLMVVGRALGVDLHPAAELAGVLVEGRLEGQVAQLAALQPIGLEAMHLGDQLATVDIGGAEQLQRAGGAAALREGAALDHHRAGVGPSHPQVRGVGAGIDPGALAQRPAVAGPVLGPPALHLDHPVVDAQLEPVDEPAAELAQGQAVAHGQGAGSDEALPARAQRQALDRAPDGIGPVQHPHRLAVGGRRLQHIEQGGDEGVDAAAEVLQVHQQHVEGAHHLAGRAAHLAIEAEDSHAVHRIVVVRRLDHVVLLVAPKAVLRAEGGGEVHPGQRRQSIQGVRQVRGHRGWMREQGHAAAFQRRAQLRVGDEAIDAELHASSGARTSQAKPSGWWKSGFPGGCASAQ